MAQDQEENRKAWPKVTDDFTVGGSTVDAQKVWEPEPGYDQGGQYGKVQVQTYRGGQSVEMDNTPGGERIKVSHPAGSYTEMQADGDVVARSNGDDYEVVAGTKNQRVQGDINIYADGNKNEKIGGQSTIEVAGLTITSAGPIKLITPHLDIVGGSVTHNGVDIGDTHKHTGVLPGGGISGVPVGGAGGGAAAASSSGGSGGGGGGSGGGDPPDDAPGATQNYVDEKIADVVDGAELDTLSQLSESIGNDPTFSSTVMSLISNTAAQFANYYTETQVDAMFGGYYTETQVDGLLSSKLDSSSYTAADVLAKMLTVDGAGSGLDADLLDGQSSAYYAVDSSVVKYTAQSKTPAEQGQARQNLGFITGDRSPIINGNFDVWQRATSQTGTGYGSDDRWVNSFTGGSMTHSRQNFALGQTDVPGNPKYFSRTVVTHAAGADNNHLKYQGIENVTTLSGNKVTVTFWAKADAAKPISIEWQQAFGSGGSPSATVTTFIVKHTLTTSWAKYSTTFDVPSVSGKTLGTSGDAVYFIIWFEGGSTWNTRTSTLGQQSGTFDIARLSVVLGDATAEADPHPNRSIQHEMLLCQRYYEVGSGVFNANLYSWSNFLVHKRVAPTVSSTSGTSITPYLNGFYVHSTSTTTYAWTASAEL